MSVTVIPAGNNTAPHFLADFLLARRCKTCDGDGYENYFEGSLMRDCRIAAWGPESLRRMARELSVAPSRISRMERNQIDFTEDIARRFLTALGIL